MIDFHSHILPNIDDGSRSIEETFNLIKEAEKVGFKAIISTSHYMENYYETDVPEREVWVKAILENLKTKNINTNLYLGNEIYFSNKIIELLEKRKASTINDTSYVLFELPLNAEPMNLYDVVYDMLQYKLVPILAHPERYSFVQKDPDLIYDLIEKGVLMQANYGSIIGQYGEKAQMIVTRFFENNMIHFLGSDVHRQNTIYPKIPQILDEIADIIGEEKLEELTTTNPELVRWFKNKEDADNISRHSTQYSLFKCPYCGNEFKYQLNAIPEGQDPPCRCKKDISYAEKMMRNIFEQLDINYTYQLSKKYFIWCQNYRYDFYFVLNGNQYIVEMDGGLGHGNVNYIGEVDTEGKYVDNIKNDLANKHNITLIRIDCFYKALEERFEYIKNNILISDLKNILNLSSIDWNEVKKSSDNLLLYQVCKLYNENYTIIDIIKELKIGKNTVLRKLRTGASIGIVDYNPKTEYQNYMNSKYNGSQLGRAIPIKVYKDNSLIGIFCSISNFEKMASSAIGEKVDRHLISQALKNGTTYKSKYTFSYASKEEYLNYYQKNIKEVV